jgi:rhamnosyltransferase
MAPPAKPHVRVLLATCNAQPWLEQQLESIAAQEGISLSVVASDDSSIDETVAILNRCQQRMSLQVMAAPGSRLGNANRNFLRLLCDAPLDDAMFIALSDHDDIWLPGKLAIAVDRLSHEPFDAYSSDVIALWPDGRRTPVVKSAPQQHYDHLFESAGPGCTFVLPRRFVDQLRPWLLDNRAELERVKVHDWLIYAFARTRGLRWCIDARAGLLYRQHGSNELGANHGLRAAAVRWQQLRDGRYRDDVLRIAQVVGDSSEVTRRLRRLNLLDRLWLAAHARQCRRRFAEALVLALAFLTTPKNRPC